MIVDEFTWDFVRTKYQLKKGHDIQRKGIAVNDQEGIVELYLKAIKIFPVPNSIQFCFKFDIPQTVLISRKESLVDMEKKLQRVLNNRLFEKQEKGVLVSKMRLWKSLTSDMEEIKGIEKKWKNSSVVKVDALCLSPMEEDRKAKVLVEDLPFAEGEEDDEIILVELP